MLDKNPTVIDVSFQPMSVANRGLNSSRLIAPEKITKVDYPPIPVIELPEPEWKIGITNSGLRIVSSRLEEKRIIYLAEGLGGKTYRAILKNPYLVMKVEGAKVETDELIISFENTSKTDFTRKEIIITFK